MRKKVKVHATLFERGIVVKDRESLSSNSDIAKPSVVNFFSPCDTFEEEENIQ